MAEAVAEHQRAIAEQRTEQQQAADTERIRQQTVEQHEKLSQEYASDVEKAKAKAKADVDAAWEPVHAAAGSQTEPIGDLQRLAKMAAETADPVVLPIVKSILSEGGVDFDDAGRPVVNGQARKVVMDGKELPVSSPNYAQMYQLQYGELPPVAAEGGEASFDRLHRLYSYLGNAIYGGGRLEAGRYNALRMLQHGVDTAIGCIAERTGQTENLANARRLTTEKLETFSDSPSEPATNASTSVRETTGDWQKEQVRRARLDMLGRYDRTLPAKAERIRSLERTLNELPSEKQTAGTNKPEPEPPALEPKPKLGKLAELPVVKQPMPAKAETPAPDLSALARKELDHNLKKYGAAGQWVWRLILGGGIKAVGHAVGGGSMVGGEWAGDYLLGQGALSLLSNALRRDRVLNWLARPTAEDIAAINSLPPRDAAKMREALTGLAVEDAKHGGAGKVDGKVATFLGPNNLVMITAALAASRPKTAAEAKARVKTLRTAQPSMQ